VSEVDQAPRGRRLLRRDERRAQLIRAAATAFARQGFAATSLEDVAREAGVTKVLIYRHFESKTVLYEALLNDARGRIRARVGPPEEFGEDTVRALVGAACDDPDGYRLLHRHAQREPEFAAYAEELGRDATEIAERRLRETMPEPRRRQWVARLLPVMTTEIILSWLDAGQPTSLDELAQTIRATQRALTDRG
jgi:AcrR family transcriptional regulator